MKKGISPVVATALLLVIAVVGVIGFQLWNEAFQSAQTSLAEDQVSTLPYDFTIDSIRGELMYVYSSRNQTFSNVSIAGVACNISTNLTPGLNRINISTCVQVNTINEVVYVLDNNEFGVRSVFPKDSNLVVSVGSITVNVTFWTNITDPSANNDRAQDIAIDSNDNVYITGSCDGCGNTGGEAFYIMKFDDSGINQWTNITDPTVNNDILYGIAIDSSDNVYVTGDCDACGDNGGRAIYTTKFDTNGIHQWTNITDPTAGDDRGYELTVDSSNNVYVTGSCSGCGSEGLGAFYTMKFDTNGIHQWTNITDPTSSEDRGAGVVADSSNNIYIIGGCSACGALGSNAIYIMKFDTNGVHQWTNITDPTVNNDDGVAITIDSNDNIYTAAYCVSCGSTGSIAFYTMKFDENGVHQWTNITDPTAGFDLGNDITSDSNNNVYIGGYCVGCGSEGIQAFYTMKFDTNGVHQWTNITDPTASNDIAYGIASDSNDDIYVTGQCNGCGSEGGQAIYTIKLNGDTGIASN